MPITFVLDFMTESFQDDKKIKTTRLEFAKLYHIFYSYHWFHCTWLPSPLSSLVFGWNLLNVHLDGPFCFPFFDELFHQKFQSWATSCPLLGKVSLNDHFSPTKRCHTSFFPNTSENFWKRHLHVFKPASLWHLTGKDLLGCVLPTSLFLLHRSAANLHRYTWTLAEARKQPPTRVFYGWDKISNLYWYTDHSISTDTLELWLRQGLPPKKQQYFLVREKISNLYWYTDHSIWLWLRPPIRKKIS